MIKVTGKIISDKSGIKIRFSSDLAHLYNWFILKETGMILQVPKYSSKIGLYRPDSYHDVKPNQTSLKKWKNEKIEVTLDPTKIRVLFSKKGYWVSFLNVECDNVNKVINELGLGGNFSEWNRPHMSIANGKYFIRCDQ